MGLLDKVVARVSPDATSAGLTDIEIAINDFHQENPMFHCVVMHFSNGQQQGISDIARMAASHGVVCFSLDGNNGLILLPGRLDMELFSHQFSQSTGSTVLFQFSANSPFVALETLSPYLQ